MPGSSGSFWPLLGSVKLLCTACSVVHICCYGPSAHRQAWPETPACVGGSPYGRLGLCLLMAGWTHPASPGVGRKTLNHVGLGDLAVRRFVCACSQATSAHPLFFLNFRLESLTGAGASETEMFTSPSQARRQNLRCTMERDGTCVVFRQSFRTRSHSCFAASRRSLSCRDQSVWRAILVDSRWDDIDP